jgi:hypothetical protein
VLRVALSILGLDHPASDATRDGDRPARAFKRSGGYSPHRQGMREADTDFSDWLGRTLHEAYDPIAREPLPHDLAVLIRHIDQLSTEPRVADT